jgi:hypothetical protein
MVRSSISFKPDLDTFANLIFILSFDIEDQISPKDLTHSHFPLDRCLEWSDSSVSFQSRAPKSAGQSVPSFQPNDGAEIREILSFSESGDCHPIFFAGRKRDRFIVGGVFLQRSS